MSYTLRSLTLVLVFAAAPSWAAAEQVRYRFVPSGPGGVMAAAPIGPEGTLGELRRGLGVAIYPYPYAVTPSHMVTFRHPFQACPVTVPLLFPQGPSRSEQHPDRIVYQFDAYTIEVRFLPNGAVDVVYNSGALRPLAFN